MSDHRAFRGIWIPAELWMTDKLSLQEKVMLVEIDSLQDPERGCFKSNTKLAEFFSLSPSRVSAIISSLADKGYVRVKQVRKNKQVIERRIFMVCSISDAFGGGQDPEEGYSGSSANPGQDPEGGYSGSSEERGSGVRGSERGVQEEKPSVPSDDVTAVFEHWREVMGKTRRTALDSNRKTLIAKALKTYSLDDVKAAITGCSLSPYHMGENPSRKVYDGLNLILRNAEKIEQFIGYTERQPASVHHLDDHRPRPKHFGLDQATSAGMTPRSDGTFSL